MKTYVTLEELKTYMGVTTSTKDGLIKILNNQATDIVNGILSANDLSLHKVTDEVHDAVGKRKFYLHDPHVIAIGGINEIIANSEYPYTQDDAYDIDNDQLIITGFLTAGPRKARITYAAGWNLGGSATAEVLDYASLAGKTFTITVGKTTTVLTEGTDWNRGTSNEAAAEALSAAIRGVKGIDSFFMGTTVYIIDETPNRATTAIATNALEADLELSASVLGNVDFPESIKGAIMIWVSDMFTRAKNTRVRSYTIGSKQVTFASDNEAELFTNLMNGYKRANILIV